MPHSEVEATYSLVESTSEGRSLQIDTYGSSFRKIVGKKSQSIRFSPEALSQVKAVLIDHF
ncbi:MAG TPA: hypothetical protein VGD62_12745 [Acidobacteriaceae bacterium]